jgi:hypothetical protein
MKGSVFINADRGYDAEAANFFKRIFELLMILTNIKQRELQKGPRGPGRKRFHNRMEGKKMFDEEVHHYRGMIEASNLRG